MFVKVLRTPLTMVRPRRRLPFPKRNYLLDNIIVTVFVPMKLFLNTARKCVKNFALFFNLKDTVMQI